MKLKDFIERYENYTDEINLIVLWAVKENKEMELIKILSELAYSVAEKDREYRSKVREWAYYAYSTVMIPISADSTFPVCINRVRMADLAFSQDDIFVKVIDEILECDNIKLYNIRDMHPAIYNRYMKAKENMEN